MVAFESPQRLPRSLAVLARVVPERPCAVCRELTKRHEEVARGTVSELAERFARAGAGRGDARARRGAAGEAADEEAALAAVAELVEAGVPRRQAAELVSRLTGASRNTLYRGSL